MTALKSYTLTYCAVSQLRCPGALHIIRLCTVYCEAGHLSGSGLCHQPTTVRSSGGFWSFLDMAFKKKSITVCLPRNHFALILANVQVYYDSILLLIILSQSQTLYYCPIYDLFSVMSLTSQFVFKPIHSLKYFNVTKHFKWNCTSLGWSFPTRPNRLVSSRLFLSLSNTESHSNPSVQLYQTYLSFSIIKEAFSRI